MKIPFRPGKRAFGNFLLGDVHAVACGLKMKGLRRPSQCYASRCARWKNPGFRRIWARCRAAPWRGWSKPCTGRWVLRAEYISKKAFPVREGFFEVWGREYALFCGEYALSFEKESCAKKTSRRCWLICRSLVFPPVESDTEYSELQGPMKPGKSSQIRASSICPLSPGFVIASRCSVCCAARPLKLCFGWLVTTIALCSTNSANLVYRRQLPTPAALSGSLSGQRPPQAD